MRLIAIWIVSMNGIAGLATHQFEDGFVERTFSIVVRDRTAHCEYSIGLNDKTLLELANPGPITKRTDPKDDPNLPSDNEPPNNSPRDLAQKELDVPDSPRLILNEKQKKSLIETIAKKIEITCNLQSVEITNVTIGAEPRHPFRIMVQFDFELPNQTSIELKIRDKNFPGQPGAFRGAIKTRGNATLLNSNVAPILVRAKRVTLESGTQGKDKKAVAIDAKIAILPSS